MTAIAPLSVVEWRICPAEGRTEAGQSGLIRHRPKGQALASFNRWVISTYVEAVKGGPRDVAMVQAKHLAGFCELDQLYTPAGEALCALRDEHPDVYALGVVIGVQVQAVRQVRHTKSKRKQRA